MNKHRTIYIIFLSTIIIASAAVTFYFISNLERVDTLIVIPLLIFVISLALLITVFINIKNTRSEQALRNRLDMWNSITFKVKKAGETAFNKLPIGIIVIDNNNKIVWANATARTIFMSQLENLQLDNLSTALSTSLEDAKEELTDDITDETKITYKCNIYGKIYYVEYLIKFNVMYLTDITDFENLQNLYYNRTETIGYINIDNLEEALKDFDAQTKAEHEGKIIGTIAKWALEYGVYVQALSSSKYILIADQEHLNGLMDDNFKILDDIKLLFNTSRTVRITLSMGIACNDENVNELSKEAENQLELALSRGGDQVVVKQNNMTSFFGAKTDPITKESKVEIRAKSEELTNLMLNSSNIFVTAHKNVDADGFAATVAILRWAKSLGKDAYIIYDPESVDTTVSHIIESIHLEYVSFLESLITPKEVLNYRNKDSLIVVVDYQTMYQALDAKMVNSFTKIAVIDHHRRGDGAFQDPKFYYSQTSASSSVELILELMEYLKEPVQFNELEATWMLLGIVVDTNNFVYRTSTSTFEVAAILKKYGADSNQVKEYLKEDIEEKKIRQQIMANLEIYKNIVAIAHLNNEVITDRATLAKASDELLSVKNIDLAITIGRLNENQIGLSARSLGKVNCQVMMEKLGGGGHLNSAAAQRSRETVDETLIVLKEKLDEFFSKEENMKVILIKDLKEKNKFKGDIIDVATGYGNNLIRTGVAILATPENQKTVEEEKNQRALKEAALVQEMKDLKELIEKTEIKIPMKVGKEGKLFGSVSSKQIIEALNNRLNVKLDKHKLELESPIASLGTYTIPINLCKGVVAKIKLFVIEG